MSFFTFNADEAKDFDVLPAGNYECYITEFKKNTFNSGADGFKAVYTIRTDVDQQGGKRKLFDNYVMTDAAAFKFHQLFKAIGLANNTSFSSPEQIMQTVINQPILVKVAIRKYNNEDQNNVVSVLASKAGGGASTGGASDPFGFDAGGVKFDESDLPF